MSQTFTVQGMTCGHCEKAVTSAIRTLDPQAQVRIEPSQNLVEVDTTQPRAAVAQAHRNCGHHVPA